ncbi:replication initiation protein [Nonomuraea sp. NBC_00507]|uniref:replication initiator n=1 Tax=Nonomuraea sp. NBC_00507 TaxID=2976002 RepID=UPI002E178BA2
MSVVDTAPLVSIPRGLQDRFRAVARLGGCSQPIRVRGDVRHVLPDGRVRLAYSTRREPGCVMLVPCGNRRASRCPSCAETYRADTFHLIRAGLLGGDKGVPATVRTHPRVLATFTAPGFGAVHAHRPRKDERRGLRLPCHPRRNAATCPHGRRMSCTDRHEADDELVGQPLCADCYDYTGHVLWNAEVGRLWQRFTMRLRRELAQLAGLTEAAFNRQARVSFAKVAEFQARGMVHFHAVIRVDGRDSDGDLADAPDWATVELLADAIRAAAAGVHVSSPNDPASGGSRRIVFGHVDVAPIVADELTGAEMTEEKVAGYIAKYATKGATTEGTVDRRIKERGDIDGLALTPHQRRLIDTCWQLGDTDAHPKLAGLRLRPWAHMLGYRGHFSTKSRRYSTTLGALREVRCSFRRQQALKQGGDRWQPVDSSTLVIATWHFAGQGYVDAADTYIATLVRQEREERRRSRWPQTRPVNQPRNVPKEGVAA